MYELLHTYDPVTQQFGLLNTPLSRANYLRDAEMRNTNWFDLLFNTNVMHNHSVSISSGNDKTSYYASLSALVDPGWTKDSKVNRYTANLNATYNILTNLSLNLISSGSYRKQKAPGTLSQSTDPVSGEVKRDFDINPYMLCRTVRGPSVPQSTIPVIMLLSIFSMNWRIITWISTHPT